MRRGRTTTTLVMMVFCCSCAAGPPGAATVPRFEHIAFVTPQDIPELAGLESRSAAVGEPAAAAAGMGTVGGALVGAAICGPVLYGACVAIMSWYGLVAGTVGGTAVGLFNYSGLSDTDRAYLEEILRRLAEERALRGYLSKQLERRIDPRMVAPPGDANVHVFARVSRIDFTKASGDVVQMRVVAEMTLASSKASEEETYSDSFSLQASPRDIDDLIADDGALLESVLDVSLAAIAEQMVERLAQMQIAASDNGSR